MFNKGVYQHLSSLDKNLSSDLVDLMAKHLIKSNEISVSNIQSRRQVSYQWTTQMSYMEVKRIVYQGNHRKLKPKRPTRALTDDKICPSTDKRAIATTEFLLQFM